MSTFHTGDSVTYQNEQGVVITTIDAWYGQVVQVRFDAMECVRALDSELVTTNRESNA